MKINKNNRERLTSLYVNNIVSDLDIEGLACIAYDTLVYEKDQYTNQELEDEIKEYYPELLNDRNYYTKS